MSEITPATGASPPSTAPGASRTVAIATTSVGWITRACRLVIGNLQGGSAAEFSHQLRPVRRARPSGGRGQREGASQQPVAHLEQRASAPTRGHRRLDEVRYQHRDHASAFGGLQTGGRVL